MKQSVLDAIQLVHDMRDLLSLAECDLTFHPECNSLPDIIIQEAITWLTSIKNTEYRAAKKIRDLMTEERWKKYESWGYGDEFQEVKAWNLRLSNLKIALKEKPDFFKRKVCDKLINNQIKEHKREHKNHEHSHQGHETTAKNRGNETNQPAM